jgi:hypothetical protein
MSLDFLVCWNSRRAMLRRCDSQRIQKLASKLRVHSVDYAAKPVHTRRALSSTITNSHQEPVPGQACNPPDSHLSFSFGGGVLRYPVSKGDYFLLMWGVVFTMVTCIFPLKTHLLANSSGLKLCSF